MSPQNKTVTAIQDIPTRDTDSKYSTAVFPAITSSNGAFPDKNNHKNAAGNDRRGKMQKLFLWLSLRSDVQYMLSVEEEKQEGDKVLEARLDVGDGRVCIFYSSTLKVYKFIYWQHDA